jgi:metal-responsive CopG/Arc/MetJ family transcriptional regulator
MKTIKIESDLWKRVEEYAKKSGYSSPAEFVEHLIEKELSRAEQQAGRDEVERRLKGLGYVE